MDEEPKDSEERPDQEASEPGPPPEELAPEEPPAQETPPEAPPEELPEEPPEAPPEAPPEEPPEEPPEAQQADPLVETHVDETSDEEAAAEESPSVEPPVEEPSEATDDDALSVDDDDDLIFLDDENDLAPILEAAGLLHRRRGRLGCILGVFFLLLILGGGGFALWWFVLREKPATPPAPETETEEQRHEKDLVAHTPKMLRQRRQSLRLKTAMRNGGTEETERAVDSALGYLSRMVEKDGHWDTRRHGSRENADLALTGLSLLAFAGAGQTAQEGDYQDVVKRAQAYLISHQDPKTGLIWQARQAGHGPGYTHAICAMALVELGALDRDEDVTAAASKAVAYAVDVHQFKKKGSRGGWRYKPGEWGDTSVTGWFMMLVKVAPQAGIEIPPGVAEGAAAFLESCRTQEKDEHGNRLHLYGYTNRTGITPRRSVIGCLCRLYADTDASALLPSVDHVLASQSPSWDRQDWYYWYYGMLLTFQVDRERFQKWNLALRDHIVSNQSTEGDLAGSWESRGDYGLFGRVFSTAMAALCLEVYYRYTPKEKG